MVYSFKDCISYLIWRFKNLDKIIPYPLRAARICLVFSPFCFWFKPVFVNLNPNERCRKDGDQIWRFRWLWFELSYNRWL